MLLEKAFEANRLHMYRAARRVGANHVEAQEAVSRAVEKLQKMVDTIDFFDQNKVKGLMCAVAAGAAKTNFKQTKVGIEAVKTWLAKQPPADKVGDLERTISVHKALNRMPEQDRWIAWRYFALEFSLQEMVEDLAEKGTEWSRQYLFKYIRKVVKPGLKNALEKEGFNG